MTKSAKRSVTGRICRPLVLGAVVALSLTAAACGSGSGSGSGSTHVINIYLGSDTNEQALWYKAFIPAFEKAYPSYKINFTFDQDGQDATTVLDRLVTSVNDHHAAQFDVIGSVVASQSLDKYLVKVSAATVPALASIPSVGALMAPVDWHAVPYHASYVVLDYNSTAVPSPPRTIAQLISWVRAHPGKFTYCPPADGGSGGSFVETVVARGVPAADQLAMVNGDPAKDEVYFKAGLALLHSINPDIYQHGVYPNSNNGPLTLLGQNQIDMTVAWSDETITAYQQHVLGPNIKVTTLADPQMTGGASYLAIPVNAPDKKGALLFSNFVLLKAQQGDLVQYMQTLPLIARSDLPTQDQKTLSVENFPISGFRLDYSANIYGDLAMQWQHEVPG
jgi:putative spermidine/putrescine transport system substrate-binding protein